MSDIVADAKAWLSERDNGTLRTHSENCHQWHAECLVARLVAEVERHRMTEEERVAAAECAIDSYGVACNIVESDAHSVTLRGYLDRTAPKEVGRE